MSRPMVDREKKALFGARFSKAFREWESREPGRTQQVFAKLLGVNRLAVYNWKEGKSIPSKERLERISKVLEVPLSYFDLDNLSHREQYENVSAFITETGRDHVRFSKKIGLNLGLISALQEMVDFDELFPLYSPIEHLSKDEETGKCSFDRKVEFMNSAKIDDKLHFLQINRDDTRITLSKYDLTFLKEVQDQLIDYVEFLFYKRVKTMAKEAELFNADLASYCNVTVNDEPTTEPSDIAECLYYARGAIKTFGTGQELLNEFSKREDDGRNKKHIKLSYKGSFHEYYLKHDDIARKTEDYLKE